LTALRGAVQRRCPNIGKPKSNPGEERMKVLVDVELSEAQLERIREAAGDGTVVVVKEADGRERRIDVKSGGLATDIPLTVLINNGTASAAEIVAGALEQNHRATLIGQSTFGTGTVLSTFRLKEGSAILLGTSQWLTPDGKLIKGKGIQPDVPVRLASQSDILTPTKAKQLNPSQIQDSSDGQLLSAVKYLEAHPEVRTSRPAA